MSLSLWWAKKRECWKRNYTTHFRNMEVTTVVFFLYTDNYADIGRFIQKDPTIMLHMNLEILSHL